MDVYYWEGLGRTRLEAGESGALEPAQGGRNSGRHGDGSGRHARLSLCRGQADGIDTVILPL
jgi:hypothetical protein